MKFYNIAAILLMFSLLISVSAQEIPENQYFRIQSAQEDGKSQKGYWDIPGAPQTVKEGETQNIQVYTVDNGPDRLFKFDEQDENQYKIIPKHGEENSCVRIENISGKNSVNLLIAEENSDEDLETFAISYKGNGVWKIHTLSGKVICLADRSSENRKNVHIWDEHSGAWTEWVFIDPVSGKKFIPEDENQDIDGDESFETGSNQANLLQDLSSIKISNISGKEAETVIKNIDQTYLELYKFESRLNKLNSNLGKAEKILNKTVVVSEKLNLLSTKINRTDEALKVFTKIPVVGPPVTAVRTTIGISKNKLDKLNDKVQKLEKPVFRPACDGYRKLTGISQSFDEKIVRLCNQLSSLKSQYSTFSGCAAATKDQNTITTFEQKSSALNTKITEINTNLVKMNKEIDKLENITNSILKIEKPIKATDKGIKAAEKVFNKTDKAAKKIENVLNKKFKKNILGKKINISVKSIISGGKIGETIEKAAKKWATKLLNPVIKKLNIKIPEIPGMDSIYKELEEMKNSVNVISEFNTKINEFSNSTEMLKSSLENQMKECTSGLQCE